MNHNFTQIAGASDRKKIGKHRIRICRTCGCTEHYNAQKLVKIYRVNGKNYAQVPPCKPVEK